MKIIITGGAGFVGSHLADKLLSAGHQLLIIDNFQTGRRENLQPAKNLQLVEGTIADKALVEKLFAEFKPEQVVHAAASYKNPDNWTEDVLTNVLGTVNIIQASKQVEVKRLIYFQTSLCYGLKPIEQPISLQHPPFAGKFEGGSSYAISKTAGELYIELSGIDFISFRLANAYGPRNITGPLPTFFSRLTKGQPCFVMDTRRDFIFIDDLIEVVLLALQGKGKKGFYHISTGSDYSIKELFDTTVAILGVKPDKEVEVRPRGTDDTFTILISPEKTIADFGWKPATPLLDGIRKTIDWYRNNGIGQTFTHLRTEEKK